MHIGAARTLLIILVCTLCTFAERLFPFIVFRGREVPAVVKYIGRVLPVAIMTALVVYCLRGVSFSSAGGFVPALAASAVTALLHIWRRSSLLSIAGGTACYMVLLRVLCG